MVKYLQTKFCRFLVSATLLTQNITRGKFMFVPQMPMNQIWKDDLLYNHFKLTEEEIQYINSYIK
jgi:site-specific DNA-methyltransferase (adenine-specific)